MSEAVKWDGFPVFGRDRDAWHLLDCEDSEHPIPMWWDWRIEAWFLKPEASAGMRAEVCHEEGYSYCAGTVTPSDLKNAIAEAVAAEREKWSATVANALNWLKHGRIANARDDLKAAQRRAVNEAIRRASK